MDELNRPESHRMIEYASDTCPKSKRLSKGSQSCWKVDLFSAAELPIFDFRLSTLLSSIDCGAMRQLLRESMASRKIQFVFVAFGYQAKACSVSVSVSIPVSFSAKV